MMRFSAVPELIAISGATFWMGSTQRQIDQAVAYWSSRLVDDRYTTAMLTCWLMKEYPAHQVALRPYSIGRFPITNSQYSVFALRMGEPMATSILLKEPDDHPVWGVGYRQAVNYCSWLSEISGVPYRLPSEAEWEFAARGPSGSEYPYGETFAAKRCNTLEGGIGHTTPVDRFADFPSEHGVVDLAGNVEEWTSDVYRRYPGGVEIKDDLARLAGGCDYHVLRGGSFARGGDLTRCARRHGPHTGPEHRYRGFRVAASM